MINEIDLKHVNLQSSPYTTQEIENTKEFYNYKLRTLFQWYFIIEVICFSVFILYGVSCIALLDEIPIEPSSIARSPLVVGFIIICLLLVLKEYFDTKKVPHTNLNLFVSKYFDGGTMNSLFGTIYICMGTFFFVHELLLMTAISVFLAAIYFMIFRGSEIPFRRNSELLDLLSDAKPDTALEIQHWLSDPTIERYRDKVLANHRRFIVAEHKAMRIHMNKKELLKIQEKEDKAVAAVYGMKK